MVLFLLEFNNTRKNMNNNNTKLTMMIYELTARNNNYIIFIT